MANDAIDKMLADIASLKRKIGSMIRPASVHEVKGDKMRMVVGKDKDGKEVLGPWLDTINHRGGSRERRFYKKGQNLTLLCPDGDLSQAIVAPFAPNKENKPPAHSNETGQDEETYQMDNLRVKKTKGGYAIWLEDDEQQEQGQQQGEAGGESEKEGVPEKHQKKDPKPTSILQIHKDGGITGRIGKGEDSVRFSASKDGAKIKAGKNFTTTTKDKVIMKAMQGDVYVHAAGTPYVNKPWVQQDAPEDPVSDDDKVLGDEEGGEGGSGGAGV